MLIEAGPDLRTDVSAEMRDGWTTGSRDFDWGLASEPDERGVVEKLRIRHLIAERLAERLAVSSASATGR